MIVINISGVDKDLLLMTTLPVWLTGTDPGSWGTRINPGPEHRSLTQARLDATTGAISYFLCINCGQPWDEDWGPHTCGEEPPIEDML